MSHTFTPDEKRHLSGVAKVATCARCGMTRWTLRGAGGDFFARSGQYFGSRPPGCIDWKIENSKTID